MICEGVLSRATGRDPITEDAERQAHRDRVLEEPARRRIVDELDKRPGLNKAQLAKRLDLRPQQVGYHVRRLQKADLVVTRPSPRGSEVLVFRAEDQDHWTNERTRILYGRAPIRRIALYLAEHPGADAREIATVVDLSPDTVREHLRTLRDRDLATALRVSRSNEYHPSRELRSWAQTTGQHYERPGSSATGEEIPDDRGNGNESQNG